MIPPDMLPSMLYDADGKGPQGGNKRGGGTKENLAIRVFVRIRPPISVEVQHSAAVFAEGATGVSVRTDKVVFYYADSSFT
jgi:hypothetical protein